MASPTRRSYSKFNGLLQKPKPYKNIGDVKLSSQQFNNKQIEDWLTPNYHFNEVNSIIKHFLIFAPKIYR